MKLPNFHKYFSINGIIYITIILVLLHFLLLMIFPIFLNLYYICWLLAFSYITYYLIASLFMILIPVEFYLRKSGHIVKYTVVNIPVKIQKYTYIFTALIYIVITVLGIVVHQIITAEEMLYD